MAEIIVTAQKREENLQNVPISISAFSGDELEARGIDDSTALATITPGLTYNNLVGYSLIYIRGETGRASCRERVCQYVSISVVAVSLKTKNNTNTDSSTHYKKTTQPL